MKKVKCNAQWLRFDNEHMLNLNQIYYIEKTDEDKIYRIKFYSTFPDRYYFWDFDNLKDRERNWDKLQKELDPFS